MDRESIIVDIEKLQDKTEEKGFKGQNEYDLFLREEIADYIVQLKAITFNKSKYLIILLLLEIDELLPDLNPIKHSSTYKQLKSIYDC